MCKCFNNISYFDCLDSSNDYLIGLYKKFSIIDPLTIYVDNQRRGRGRMGKKWVSGKSGLTFSFSVKILKRQQPFMFNMLTSIAIRNLLSFLGVKSSIKYPNDVIVNSKKIAGVLTDVISFQGHKYAIVGVGLNVNNADFPHTIPDAISLCQLLCKKNNKEDLFKKLIFNIQDLIKLYHHKKHDLSNLYFQNLLGVKNYMPAFFGGKKVFLKILHLNDQGVLTIQERNSMDIATVTSTEVQFLLT